ncbi:MAG TPA: FAD-dependent oxidoreductase [Anaerolineaceae bacterium]|nr:FAD-dependent oxidoreductase [Anaerolineaceae bacterium]
MSQPETINRYIIIGGGIAGLSAAEAIHALQPEADITLISEEHYLPYFRMSLTRYLAGEVEREKLILHNQQWYLQNHITILLNTHVEAVDAGAKLVVLEDGQKLPYDKLILASGAHPNVPPFPGRELKGVQTLRTLEDADLIMDVARKQAKVVCIGGGLLGLEVAGAVARQGAQVTVLEGLDWLLPRQLDAQASAILKEKIEELGIKVIVPAMTKALHGDVKVQSVELADGQVLPADLVLISTGVSANLELAKSAGLDVNRGVLVNEHMLTSNPDILAAGDLTEFQGRSYGLWIPAKNQGTIAGQNAVGKEASFLGDPPSTRLKVLGVDVFSIGQFSPSQDGDRLVAESKDGIYQSFLFREGKMIGSILLGDASMANKVKAAIEGKRDFTALLGENVDLESIIRAL